MGDEDDADASGRGCPGPDDHIIYFETRDDEARRRLVERYQPLATKVAARFARSRQDRDDLRQVALVGILCALDRFDPTRGVKFTTFAWATAVGEVKRYRRDSEWTMRLPRSLQERYLRVAAAADELPVEIGHEASASDIAERVGDPVDAVRECLDIRSSYPMSLDRCLEDGADGGPVSNEGGIDAVDQHDELWWALTRLRPLEREIVMLHYLDGLTQDEVASRVGGSQMRVSRALSRGLDRLAALMRPTVCSDFAE